MSENLLQKLEQYAASDFYPFHMPGHKQNISHFEHPFSIDITEIEGFDNLFHAEDVLLEAQKRAASLYGSEETFYLVGGSTCGILAAVSAAVPRGSRILMARNCHKASYHAAFLNGLRVTYLYPEMDMVRGINGSIRPEQVAEALRCQPDIRAVLLTSPTYDGVVSDIRTIAELVHRAGAILIVDEAHGAHFPMHSCFPDSALSCGADLVINSIHKTLPSLTQTALLHVQGPRADRRRLKKYLGIYQSSSPSYVLMAGIDACICLMAEQGEVLFGHFAERLEKLRKSLGQMKHLHLVDGKEPELCAFAFDGSKVLISTEKTGWSGPKLMDVLRREYHLELEMGAEHYVTAIVTVADTEEGFERLERALLEIDERIGAEQPELKEKMDAEQPELKEKADTEQPGLKEKADAEQPGLKEKADAEQPEISEKSDNGQSGLCLPNEEVMSIEEAENSPQISLPLEAGGGQVCGEYVYLYPPGIPLIVPGERISEELPARLAYYSSIGLKIQGMEDYTASRIRVVSRGAQEK